MKLADDCSCTKRVAGDGSSSDLADDDIPAAKLGSRERSRKRERERVRKREEIVGEWGSVTPLVPAAA
jgi:hypothetical protein